MYREFFGLRELPFGITPDTSYFFARDSHQEALNTLLVATRSGEGFMKITGEVGTGKTLLCRTFLAALDGKDYLTAYIPNPYVEPMTLLLAVADELGIAYPQDVSQHHLLKLMTQSLINAANESRRVVLCLDEAQAMPVETLEALRLLTNLETERRKLLQVVLFGQPELDDKLDKPAIRQLKQRITFSCELEPMSRDAMERYLKHRLGVAGYQGPDLFTRQAVCRIHGASRGVPRLVNVLAHKSMMVAFGEGLHQVRELHVRIAVLDTESAHAPWWRRLLPYAVAFVTALLVSAGALVWGGWL
jgi:MSHA biogenesis protein MshM